MFNGGNDDNHRLPRGLVITVLLASFVPAILRVLGVHIIPADVDGSLIHSLLEWSAVCASLFTAFLGFLYLRVRADYVVLTIALAAFVAGLWDALHAVASLGLIPISTGLDEFVPVTWAVSRTLTALMLMIGTALILFRAPRRAPLGAGWVVAGAFTVVVLTGAFLELAVRESLPVALRSTGLVTRPWDVPALVLFAINALVLFPMLVRRHPTILSRALLLSAIPALMASVIMTFVSSALYDHGFQFAHALKLVACLVPCIGISLFFIRAFRRERRVADRLEQTVAELTSVQDELRVKDVRLNQITENIREVFWLSSADGNEMLYVSPAYQDIFGLTAESLYQRSDSFMEVVHPDDRAILEALTKSDNQEDFDTEFRILRPDGSIRWLRTQGVPIRNEAGEVYRLAGLTEDITEAKLAQEALSKSEERNRALLEAMPDLMFLLDRDGKILDYHAHSSIPLYRPPSEFLGEKVADVFPDFGPRATDAIARTLKDGTTQMVEYRLTLGDYQGDFEARLVRSADDEVLAVVRDITEQKRLEKEVLDVSNREQHRIGHDLHDGISQQLTGIALLCKALQRRLDARGAPEATEASQIEELVDGAIAQTRSLARGLAPVQLEEGGLSAALEELALGIETRHSIRCRLRWDEDIPIPNHTFATHLYRIAQEAVTNALKHGGPSSIAINVVRDNGLVRLSVQDDGAGLQAETTRNGMGLHIMRYRARLIDATLEIRRAPERGTVVTCQWSS